MPVRQFESRRDEYRGFRDFPDGQAFLGVDSTRALAGRRRLRFTAPTPDLSESPW